MSTIRTTKAIQNNRTQSMSSRQSVALTNRRPRKKVSFLYALRQFVSSKIVYIAISVGVIYVGVNFFILQPDIQAKQEQMMRIEEKIDAANKENQRLNAEKSVVHTKKYRVRAAREKLGLVKKGEKVFVDVDKQ